MHHVIDTQEIAGAFWADRLQHDARVESVRGKLRELLGASGADELCDSCRLPVTGQAEAKARLDALERLVDMVD